MADSNIPVVLGDPARIDTRTVGTDHRQVVVLGDPTTNANVATVDASGRMTVNVFGTVTTTAVTPTAHFRNSTADTNLVNVKTTAGTVFNLTASNTGAGVAWVKLYNKATAPVLASDTPVLIVPVPAGGFVNLPFEAVGLRFGTGIAHAITGLGADTDATAVTAGQVKVAISYV